MVAHRIADPIILQLISKWLKAGALQDGIFLPAKEGTLQEKSTELLGGGRRS
jgi:hypothetical protein